MQNIIREIGRFWKEDDAIGVIEVVLILVLIGLVLIFKTKLTTLMNSLWSTVVERSGSV